MTCSPLPIQEKRRGLVARSEDKRRVRLNVINHLLKQIGYKDVPVAKVKLPKRKIGRSKSRRRYVQVRARAILNQPFTALHFDLVAGPGAPALGRLVPLLAYAVRSQQFAIHFNWQTFAVSEWQQYMQFLLGDGHVTRPTRHPRSKRIVPPVSVGGRHFRQPVRDALVAVDAGPLPGGEIGRSA